MDALRRLGDPLTIRAELLPPRPTTRFAPSVTGVLHLGHVLNAVVTWGLARALGGRVILRLEDHDRARWRAEHEASILDDLDWLGLEPDEGSIASFRAGPSEYRQGDSSAAYEEALARLAGAATVFSCDCTRRDLAGGSALVPGAEPVHGGPCRERAAPPGPDRGVRLLLGAGEERFVDAALGPQVQVPEEQCGDLLLRDRQGQWSYHFAVVVDDLRQGVDLIVRGSDLLDATGRQLRLARLLGRATPPVHVHHPLVTDDGNRKLSKTGGAAGIAVLREAGLTPSAVLGQAAFLGGLQDDDTAVSARDLAPLLERHFVA